MKYALVAVMMVITVVCNAFECLPTGPVAQELSCANYHQFPNSFGGVYNDQNVLFLCEEGVWNPYPFWANGLTITSVWKLNDATMMVAMGAGTYSDGLYNFDINSHVWTLNEWFMEPHFVWKCINDNLYYLGERDGLYKSTNGSVWNRVTQIGTGDCTSLAHFDANFVVNCGSSVYYTADCGENWLMADTANLMGFRFTDSGVLYGIMNDGSDSDGLWRSNDYGANWNVVLYTSNLSCIGPDFGGYMPLGWSQANENGKYAAILTPQHELIQLDHQSLSSGVKQMDTFPLVNTPSFYVINGQGCFYLTGFAPSAVDDEMAPGLSDNQLCPYPNPTSDKCTIELKDISGETCALKVYNLKGQLIRTCFGQVNQNGRELCLEWDLRKDDGSRVSPGVYLMELRNEEGKKLGNGKIVAR